MKKSKNKNSNSTRPSRSSASQSRASVRPSRAGGKSRSPQERQRLVALWIFTLFLAMTVGLIGYGLWASFS